jgi:predicted ATP-grasp superfamily ATP-dependent carboligase
MRLLMYEYCCAGGSGLDTLAPEARAMLQSLVTDAVNGGGLEVVALLAEGLTLSLPAAARVRRVAAGRELDMLVAASTAADAVLIVAPETDGILAARVATVRAAGAHMLAPAQAFIEIASDKQATTQALAAAGVPVPAGRALAAGEPWPDAFIHPAVRKARDGTGGDGFVVVDRNAPEPPPARRALTARSHEWDSAFGTSWAVQTPQRPMSQDDACKTRICNISSQHFRMCIADNILVAQACTRALHTGA